MNAQPDTGTFLTAVDDLPAAIQSADKLEALLARVEAQARAHVPDLTTEAGRKAIASNAYKVATSKTALDKAGKALTEDLRAQVSAVNAVRNAAVDRLEALKVEVRAPLTEWEGAEKARIDHFEGMLRGMDRGILATNPSAAEIAAEIAEVESIQVDETWREFRDGAARTQAKVLAALREALGRQRAAEAERAELEALRAEKAAREARDRAEAAEKEAEARRIAQAKAEEDRQARIAIEREEAARLAAERATAEAERAAAERIAAAERAAQAAEEKAERDRKAADEAAARAVEQERLRAAEQRRQEEAAREKREQNARIRAKARSAIVAAITTLTTHTGQTTADSLADAIMAGGIPHVEFRP